MSDLRHQLTRQRPVVFDELEQELRKMRLPEDFLFSRHPDEDHIVLSHALFWVMSRPFEKKLSTRKAFPLLRVYQEKMLEAYLTEAPDFPELLRDCALLYEILPFELGRLIDNPEKGAAASRLMAIGIVAAGYGGNMATDQAYELLDAIDFRYNKVYCHRIERMLPLLQKLADKELENLREMDKRSL